MEAEVVVCYSSKDREAVVPFVDRLRSMGVPVWIDIAGIDGASPWRKKIVQSIKACKVLILMASKSSVISDNVIKEVILASQNKIPVLPLHLEPVELSDDLAYELTRLQHIELFRGDPESNFRKIAHDLKALGVTIGDSHESTPTIKGPSAPPLPSLSEKLPELGIDNDKPTPRRYLGKRTMVIIFVAFMSIAAVVLVGWFTINPQTHKPVSINSQPSPAPTKQTPETPQPPPGMIYVHGGSFTMGRNGADEAESPAHQVTVTPFYIDLHEVTNEDYAKFVQATSHRAPMTWTGAVYPLNAARKPVTGVTWDDANAYAAWAKKRLPTEEEWEFAARGADGRLYPWGKAWQRGLANADYASQGMADVGSYQGPSPFGAVDMIGNAWEWTASDMRAYPRGHLPAGLPPGDLKVIRGGTFDTPKDSATTTFRTGWPAQGANTYAQTGFRCAADIGQ